METLKRIDQSKKTLALVLGAIFLFLLLCNALTLMASDDYCYSFSLADGSRIRSLGDIFSSLAVHYQTTNGRMPAHFFTYLFLWLPHPIFKVLNAGMFTGLILLCYLACTGPARRSALTACVLFAGLWCFQPSFGEVNLWQDGACNYLWGAALSLVYLLPLLKCAAYGDPLPASPGAAVGYGLLGLLVGAYQENLSGSVIFLTAALLLLVRLSRKQRVPLGWLVSLGLCFAGFVFMMLAPGEHQNKLGALTLVRLRNNFIGALSVYKRFWVLLLAWGMLMLLSLSKPESQGRRLVSAVLVLGSLVSNFAYLFAAYYPLRGAFYPVILLVLADCMLLADLWDCPQRLALLCCAWALGLVTVYQMGIGLNDIYDLYGRTRQNIATIQACKAAGQMDVAVPYLSHKTEYSVPGYVSEDPDGWSNVKICDYYGIDTIVMYYE